ncbi:MAG: cation-transporting P-type ATPase, partial [Isosphaeraceae bacterium]
MSVRTASDQSPTTFWSVTLEDLLLHLQATPEGLSAEGARQRLSSGTPSLHKPVWGSRVLTLLLAQFQSPIILILLFAVALSFFLREATDALLILSIVLVSGLLGFWQEWRATDAVDKLLALV